MPMTSPESSPVQTGAARRPSLFEQPAGNARTPHREIAVLAPFATPKTAQPSVRWATAGVAAVASAFALLAGATLWAVVNGGNSEQASPPPPVAQRAPAKPAAAHAAAPAVASVAPEEPTQSQATAAVVANPAPGATMVDTLDPAEAMQPALAAKTADETGATTASPIAAARTAEAPTQVTPRHASSATPKATQHKPLNEKPKPRSTKPKGEADTALLAALVSHIDHTAAQTANRDVVGPSAQQGSTAELVARCDRLGGLEGTLCRKRICKGLWGSDPACPSR